MLFAEMVRKISQEEVLYEEAGSSWAGTHDWTTRYTKAITLSQRSILYVTFKSSTYGATADGAGRCLLDDVPLVATGGAGATEVVRKIYIVLAAGSYTFKFQSTRWAGSNDVYLNSIKICVLNFSDLYDAVYDSGSVAAGDAATTVILSEQTVPASAARKTCIGPVKTYTAFVEFYLTGVDYRNSIPIDPGAGNEAGKISWKAYVDGVQTAWTESKRDYGDAGDITYGEGAYGMLLLTVEAGSTWTLRVDVYNDTGASRNCRAYVKVMLCPWIIPDSQYEPVTLDFAQGSTLYLMLEPLKTDPTKDVRIGKQRFISFGAATDYYSSASGTGLLAHDYTFETVEVEEVLLLIEGDGGCVSIIAVDER